MAGHDSVRCLLWGGRPVEEVGEGAAKYSGTKMSGEGPSPEPGVAAVCCLAAAGLALRACRINSLSSCCLGRDGPPKVTAAPSSLLCGQSPRRHQPPREAAPSVTRLSLPPTPLPVHAGRRHVSQQAYAPD